MREKHTPEFLPEITSDADAGESEAILVSDSAPAQPRTDAGDTHPFVTVQHKPTRPPGHALPARPGAVPEVSEPESVRDGDGLIRRIEIYPWPYSFNFYQRFLNDARRYAHVRGQECPYIYFFSFIPQYYQMGEKQLAYYFYFREMCQRRERMERLEFSYILLYIYELINLPASDAAQQAEMLAWLWCTYRRPYVELDKYLSEWLCDYCIVHNVPLPAQLQTIMPVIMAKSTLREYYLSPLIGKAEDGTPRLTGTALLAAASEYDYRASRYYEKNAELYEKHIPAAVEYALSRCGFFPDGAKLTVVQADRDAFCGTLCAQTVKRRLHLEYYSLPVSKELQKRVTDAAKQAENNLRRMLKIKSRLQLQGAPALMDAVDQYFSRGRVAETAYTSEEERSYGHLYDAPTRGMDAAGAHQLESESWENTALLTDTEQEPESPPEPEAAESPAASPVPEAGDGMPAEIREILRALLAGETLAGWCARRGGKAKLSLTAAMVNDYAADRLGDVILDAAADWQLIDDYREEIGSWIN